MIECGLTVKPAVFLIHGFKRPMAAFNNLILNEIFAD